MLGNVPLLADIMENVNDKGELDLGYILPLSPGEDPFLEYWVSGGWDGVQEYHVAKQAVPDEARRELSKVLQIASKGQYYRAEKTLSRVGAEFGAKDTVGALMTLAVSGNELYDEGKIYDFAADVLRRSDSRECVKYAIGLLALYHGYLEDEELWKDLQTAALSDEFTWYVLMGIKIRRDAKTPDPAGVEAKSSTEDIHANADGRAEEESKAPDAAALVKDFTCDGETFDSLNDRIYRIAQRVHGWGRIHAVEMLEPTTEEIREWFMTEGFYNTVMEEYTALTCYRKANVQERIHENLTTEEFQNLGELIAVLLEKGGPGGPTAGIDEIQDSSDLLLTWLDQAEHRDSYPEDYLNVDHIKDYCMDHMRRPGMEEVYLQSYRILSSPKAKEAVIQALSDGDNCYVRLARWMKLPYQKYLLESMRKDLLKNYHNIFYLKEAEWTGEILAIYREQIPPQTIDEHSEEISLWENTIVDNRPLSKLLEHLIVSPGGGIDYVKAALASNADHARGNAAFTLWKWVCKTKMPLKELSGELYQAVEEALRIEDDDDVAERMRLLLSGEVGDDDPGEYKFDVCDDLVEESVYGSRKYQRPKTQD